MAPMRPRAGAKSSIASLLLSLRSKRPGSPIVTSLSTEQLSLAIGRSNVVHAALIQGGATQRFLSEAERLERYRSGSCCIADRHRHVNERA